MSCNHHVSCFKYLLERSVEKGLQGFVLQSEQTGSFLFFFPDKLSINPSTVIVNFFFCSCLQKEKGSESSYHARDGGNHSIQDASPCSHPLFPCRAVLFPQKTTRAHFHIIYILFNMFFPCQTFTFFATTATIQRMPPTEQDVPPAAVPLDTSVFFPCKVSSTKLCVWSQQTAILF